MVLSLVLARPPVVNAATLTVTSTADDGTGTCTASKCTLRDAILSAAVSGDTITFSLPANSAIALTNGQLLMDKNLRINGPGANRLTVQRSAASGTPQFRIFQIASNIHATISGLTVANGNASGQGGGIYNTGTVFITNSTISGNTAVAGGGIYNTGTVGIKNSTISGNTAFRGGGIFNDSGTVTITNSTISGNSATDSLEFSGGGIYDSSGALTITNSTISGNTAGSAGGGIYSGGDTVIITNSTLSGNSAFSGGGIHNNSSTLESSNTIIALNTAPNGPDVFGTLTSQGFNLIGNTSGMTITGTTTGNQLNVDPKLDTLKDNGGPTFTRALLPGSPAIDTGITAPDANTGNPITTDQRGFARPVDSPIITNTGDGSDIGAYEVQPDQLVGCSETNLVVNNNSDGTAGSLRAVVANACGGSTITFAANVRGAINLTSGELLIDKNLTINGPGANLLSVQRSASAGNFRIFNIAPASVNATISGLTIANGNVGNSGGGISNTGTLTLINATISGNTANNGGAIFNNFGTVTITNSTISANTVSSNIFAGSGGGIFNSGGTVSIGNSTISGNSANGPGGNSDSGGGIITNVGMVGIFNSTISGNSGDIGGGIRNVNGGAVTSSNTIIALNTSASGPDVNGTLTSEGYNLIGDNAGATITPARSSDQIGVTPAQLDLGPLQDNGGPTQTHALLSGSFAIDKGGFIESPSTDQRGFTRPVDLPSIPNATDGDGSDIGAFEVQAPAPTPTPTPSNTPSVSATATATATSTGTATPSTTPTPTNTATNTPTCTGTWTFTNTRTPTLTPTKSPTSSPTSAASLTPTNTPTMTPGTTRTPTATPTATPMIPCVGNCNASGSVSVADIITLVNIALGDAQPSACPQGIPSGAGVNVDLVVQSVNNALNGCR